MIHRLQAEQALTPQEQMHPMARKQGGASVVRGSKVGEDSTGSKTGDSRTHWDRCRSWIEVNPGRSGREDSGSGAMEGTSEIGSGIGSVNTGLAGSETIGELGSGNVIVGKASEGALGGRLV